MFYREDPESTVQTAHYTTPATTWIVASDETVAEFDFDEVMSIMSTAVAGYLLGFMLLIFGSISISFRISAQDLHAVGLWFWTCVYRYRTHMLRLKTQS